MNKSAMKLISPEKQLQKCYEVNSGFSLFLRRLSTEAIGNKKIITLHAFFYKQHFYKQRQAEICRKLSTS